MSINFFEIINKDGNPYYIIPEGTKIYRGIKKKKFDKYSEVYDEFINTFFAFDIDAARLYGNSVYEFIFTKPVLLLALDKIGPNFFDKCPENIKKILQEHYGYKDGSLSEMRIRYSINEKDSELVKYLCKNGEIGYATNFMHKEGEYYADGNPVLFHKELVLCGDKINFLTDGINVDHYEAPPELKSKKRPHNSLDKSPKRSPESFRHTTSLFNDSPEPFIPTSSLFNGSPTKIPKSSFKTPGGYIKIKRKSKKIYKKSRKNKKTTRIHK
jgi:hypothetical protein